MTTILSRRFVKKFVNQLVYSSGRLVSTTSSFEIKLSKSQLNTSQISFADYRKLKQTFKTKQRVAGLPFAFTGLTLSSIATAYFVPDMFDATPENVQLIMGLDPIVFCGICGVSASLVGYVVGTNAFKTLWSVMNKAESQRLHERDLDFLQRLEKHRFGQDSKFEDDYYGESIKTLSDYRQWLRTQQRKRENAEKFKIKPVEKI